MANFQLTDLSCQGTEDCNDGLDNDGDTLIDCADTDDCTDFCSATEICDDGLDNDYDATIDNNGIDCNDNDCSGHPFCETCNDRGQTCDEDAECCSRKCRGPEGYERCIGRP